MSLLQRLRRHNLISLLRLIPVNVIHYARYYSPGVVRARRLAYDFDCELGVDTAKSIPVGALGGDQWFEGHASPYAPVGAALLRSTLAALPIADFARFLFIDYGSGKGKALLIAAEFGFAEIIGVEFSTGLHQIAGENVRNIQNRSSTGARFTLVNADAAAYRPPAGAKVAFFFNPFDETVMRKVLDVLDDPVTTPELLIIYVNPKNRSLFDTGRWAAIADYGSAVIYRRDAEAGDPSQRSAQTALPSQRD